MRVIGNLLWFCCFGWLLGIGWFVAGALLAITVVGLPWTLAAWRIARFALFPIGREVIRRKELTGRNDQGTGTIGFLLNVVWFFLGGWYLVLAHIIAALLCTITIIGIPFAIQHLKLAGIALAPVGAAVVEKELAQAARKANAEAKLAQVRTQLSAAPQTPAAGGQSTTPIVPEAIPTSTINHGAVSTSDLPQRTLAERSTFRPRSSFGQRRGKGLEEGTMQKTIVAFVFAGLFALPRSAFADEVITGTTTQDLYGQCKSRESVNKIACLQYLIGVEDMMRLLHVISEDRRTSTAARPILLAASICAPPTTGGQFAQAFINWAERNPKSWQDDRVGSAWSAFRATWPCN